MSILTLKTVKTTPQAKDLLASAAALDGLGLSAFVLSSAIEKAKGTAHWLLRNVFGC